MDREGEAPAEPFGVDFATRLGLAKPRPADAFPAKFRYADGMDSNEFRVHVCPASLRATAVRWLHDRLPSDQQAALLQAVDGTAADDDEAWEGLFLAEQSRQLIGVAWLQPAPGRTAVVWSPGIEGEAAERLFSAIARLVDAREIPLAQYLGGATARSVARDAARPVAEIVPDCGFYPLTSLAYLYADLTGARGRLFESSASNCPVSKDDSPAFLPFAGDAEARFIAVLEATYQQTLDCPQLDGVRAMADVLEGYRSQGRHLPQHWYFVRRGDRDAGALILASHPGTGNWELVYMGVAPWARGGGLGRKIVRHALACATAEGAERLVLAVDAANRPARDAYLAEGFVEWDRRTIHVRLGNQNSGGHKLR